MKGPFHLLKASEGLMASACGDGGLARHVSHSQMKISFNDKSLQTTFEYPSESSLVQEEEVEAEEEEEEEGEEGEEEEDERLGSEEKPFALFLPRATFVSSVGPESPRMPDGSSGECPGMGSWEGVAPGPQVHVSVSMHMLLGPQACPAILQSTPWPSASGRSRHWCRLRGRQSPRPKRSW